MQLMYQLAICRSTSSDTLGDNIHIWQLLGLVDQMLSCGLEVELFYLLTILFLQRM